MKIMLENEQLLTQNAHIETITTHYLSASPSWET